MRDRSVLKLQAIIREVAVRLSVGRIGNHSPKIIDGCVRRSERRVHVVLYAFPCSLGDWHIEQRGINHHFLSKKEPRSAYAQRRCYMPSPVDKTVGVIPGRDMEITLNPYLPRCQSHVDHQPAHFVSPRPTAIVWIEERNTGWRDCERIAAGRLHRVEDLLCLRHGKAMKPSPPPPRPPRPVPKPSQ